MKTKFLFVAALTMLMCTSCQKEDSECGVKSGLDTYAGITISFPRELAVSRALATGTAEESTINSVKIGTWSDNSSVITYTTLLGSDFTHDGNGNYTAYKIIDVKTGKNNFFVIANSEEELTISQINGTEVLTKTVADIATKNNFVMYSVKVNTLSNVQRTSQKAVENATPGSSLYNSNRISVTLRRAAAKVSVTSMFSDNGVDIDEVTIKGRFHDIKWNIANQNSQMNAIVNELYPRDGFVVSNVESPLSRIENETPTIDVPMSGVAASSAYCLENSHPQSTYTTSNTTAIHVMAVFVPKDRSFYTKSTDITGSLVLGTNFVKGSSFFVSEREAYANGKYYPPGTIFDRSGADYIVENYDWVSMDEFTEYTNGECHWPVYIYDGVKTITRWRHYGVLRNHNYEMKLISINSLGVPIFPDDDIPITDYAYVDFIFNVEQWEYRPSDTVYL